MAHIASTVAGGAGLIALVGLASCGIGDAPPIGPMEEFHQVLEAEEASSGRIELDFAAGEVELAAGSVAMMELHARFNVADWRPDWEEEVRSGRALVKVKQGGDRHGMTDEHVNEWQVLVGTGRPIEFDFDFGIGLAKVNLADVTTNKVEVDAGVGKLVLDLNGVIGERIKVNLDAGIGEVIVRFSSESSVVADVDQGIGAVETDDFDKKDGRYHHEGSGEQLIELNVDAGIGRVSLEFAD